MINSVILISALQIAGDLACLLISLALSLSKTTRKKSFFAFNAMAFFLAMFGDVYYNYAFRISHNNILESIGVMIIVPVLSFQILQAINWYTLLKGRDLLSINNLPYLIFSLIVIGVLVYYFATSNDVLHTTIFYQSFSIVLDMLIWFFAIVCLSRTTSLSVVLLAFGSLMIISADLTSRALFMFEMDKLANTTWVHVVWMLGVWSMFFGFCFSKKANAFKFCNPKSIQASCNAWTSTVALITFFIGAVFLVFFKSIHFNFRETLWSLPIALMFLMIASCLLGNWFSNFILVPVITFMEKIRLFKNKEHIATMITTNSRIYEFGILGDFIDDSFKFLSHQLDLVVKTSAQVAHDIRSPLNSLEIVNKRIPSTVTESLRIALRDAINDIRDITNQLDEKKLVDNVKTTTQIAVLLEQAISNRRLAYSENPDNHVEIQDDFDAQSYTLFVEIIPSEMKRIIINVLNNAFEALINQTGKITVSVYSKNFTVMIKISDNGQGISPDVINKLFHYGFTTKTGGSGLGLSHAKETLLTWGGNIEFLATSELGAHLLISLPLAEPPIWFIGNITLPPNSTVVCVDDSISMYHVWNERLNPYINNIELLYCKNKTELLSTLNTQHKLCTYLVDFEFHGHSYTGIDLIEEIFTYKKSLDQVYMVTSHFDDKNIQAFCKEKAIFLIPKFFATRISIALNKNLQN